MAKRYRSTPYARSPRISNECLGCARIAHKQRIENAGIWVRGHAATAHCLKGLVLPVRLFDTKAENVINGQVVLRSRHHLAEMHDMVSICIPEDTPAQAPRYAAC